MAVSSGLKCSLLQGRGREEWRGRRKAYKPQKVHKALEVELPGGRKSSKQLLSQQHEQSSSDSAR